ncbi:MAG: terminase family protein [Acidobacteria bacterium]|nr:terminase family protein [Acidobacteriota bacterium]
MARDLRHVFDPAAWARDALGFESDPWQAGFLRAGESRVILNTSRQVGKSTVCALLACHQAIFRARSEIIVISPSLRQSGELFRKLVRFLGSLGTGAPLEENRTTYVLPNGSRILSLPGSEDTVRGFSGVNLILMDEAARIDDDLLSAVTPMVATSGGRIVLLSTPAGRRGVFHKLWTDGEGWRKVRVPAAECPRIPPGFLAAERLALGETLFRQEYACEFVDDLTAVFSMDAIHACRDDSIQPLHF